MNDHTSVIVATIPPCDLCGGMAIVQDAYADAQLPMVGPWANVCKPHFDYHRCGLGLGRGQRLILREEDQA